MQIFIKIKSSGKTITYDPPSKDIKLNEIFNFIQKKYNLILHKNTLKIINDYDNILNFDKHIVLDLNNSLIDLYKNKIVKEICFEIE